MKINDVPSWCCKKKIQTRIVQANKPIEYCPGCKRILDVVGIVRSYRGGKL